VRIISLVAVVLVTVAVIACGDEDAQPVVRISPEPSSEVSPTATPVSLPEKPSSIDEFPATIADYLTQAGGSPDCLAELFEAWEVPSDGTMPCVAADLDGDGEDEYVVRIAREGQPEDGALEGWLAGTIAIFDRDIGTYGVVFSLADVDAPASVDFLQPVIYAVDDLNGDGRHEVLLTTSTCGAHTCNLAVYLLGYEGGEYIILLRPSAQEPEGVVVVPVTDDQLRVEDLDGDGIDELLLREGLIGSVGAGPQREAVRNYRWDGRRYTLANVEFAPSDLRYFKVRDADDALTGGDAEAAAALYREAVESAGLQDVDFGDPAELIAYARFRIGLTEAILEDKAAALAALDAAVAADPVALHSELATRFRQGYTKVGHVSAGCAAARDFVRANREAFAQLWDYGYANPEFDPDFLCPF
jgi:hypothetical protein